MFELEDLLSCMRPRVAESKYIQASPCKKALGGRNSSLRLDVDQSPRIAVVQTLLLLGTLRELPEFAAEAAVRFR